MRITFKLYASLTEYLPAEARSGNRVPLDVAEGTTIAQVIEPFSLPAKSWCTWCWSMAPTSSRRSA